MSTSDLSTCRICGGPHVTGACLEKSPKLEVGRRKIILPKNLIDIGESETELDKLDHNDYSGNIVLDRKMEESIIRERISQERFWNMLVSSVNERIYSPPQDRNTQILDMGCSICEEKGTVSLFFGGEQFALGTASHNVNLTGVDSDDDAMAIARKNIPRGFEQNYSFITADMANPDDPNNDHIPPKADVVIIRHQQMFKPLSDDDAAGTWDTWAEIIDQSLDRLDGDSIAIITSYTQTEHDQLVDYLDGIGAKIVKKKENRFSEPYKGGGIDKFVVIIKPGEKQ